MKSFSIPSFFLERIISSQITPIYMLLIVIFSIIITLLITLLIFSPKSKFMRKYKSEYLAQSQAIKLERQRISEELHDELGSGLSAIKLYSELTSESYPEIVELKEINGMIKDISVKINDIIWTTSTENDQLDSVIFYIEEQIAKLFKHSSIIFRSRLPDDIPFLKIKSESRRNLYLLAKEIAHNSLKHSKANKTSLEISMSDELIALIIRDNGDGFDPLHAHNGMGLSNIRTRVKRLNGHLTIENYKGTKVIVTIPIEGNFYKENKRVRVNYFSKFWN